MNSRTSLFLFVVLAAFFAVGCASMQRPTVHVCPNCKTVVPEGATECPNPACRLKLAPVGGASAAVPGRSVGAPPTVSQHPYGKDESKFLPVKVGALLEITDSNHQRVTPFVSVELFKIDQGAGQPIICFDAGVADEAIFASAGVRGIIDGVPQFGVFIFGMVDWSPTLKYRAAIHKKKAHFCSGLGVSIGGFW
jgi:hypothetical protein